MLPVLPNSPLNEHILDQIFSIVSDTSYSTIRSLLLTSRKFHALAWPLVYCNIGINFISDFKDQIQSWLINPEKSAIPRAIRHISIYSRYRGRGDAPPHYVNIKELGTFSPNTRTRDDTNDSDDSDEASKWSTIVGLILRTTQLRSLTFSCLKAMPLVLLQAIHNIPAIRLNITLWTRISPDILHTNPAELALVGSPLLRSLQAYIRHPTMSPNDLRLPAFWRLVRSAPNLESLTLNTGNRGRVMIWDGPERIQKFKTLASEFKNTTLSCPSSIKNLKIVGSILSQFKIEELSRLTTLDCSLHDLTLDIIHSLVSLTHLTLRRSYSDNHNASINDLLLALPPLISIRIIGWRKYLQLDTIMTHHGLSLRELALHEPERYEVIPRVLLIDELVRIRDCCPLLEGLSIDLNIPDSPLSKPNHLSADIHKEVYNALSSFPFLRRLQLNFNLAIARYKAFPGHVYSADDYCQLAPLADETFVKELWAVVNLGRTASSAIQELRVAQGEAQRVISQFSNPRSSEPHTHHWLKATRSERDDDSDGIKISKFWDVPDFADDVWRDS